MIFLVFCGRLLLIHFMEVAAEVERRLRDDQGLLSTAVH